MISLDTLKSELGIDLSDTADDAFLLRTIRQVTAEIRRRTNRGIAWLCDSITDQSGSARVRCIGHGLNTGDVVHVTASDSTPTLDGERTATRIDSDTVTISGVVITDSGSQAMLHPQRQYLAQIRNPNQLWIPGEALPAYSLVSIETRTLYGTWDTVSSSVYEVQGNLSDRAVPVERTDIPWQPLWETPGGYLAHRRRQRVPTVRLTLKTGALQVPDDIAQAVLSMCCDHYELQGTGRDQASGSFEGVNTSRMSGEERRTHLLSPEPVIASWTVQT